MTAGFNLDRSRGINLEWGRGESMHMDQNHAWTAYAEGFAEDGPFLTWWAIAWDRSFSSIQLSRFAFLNLALSGVSALRRLGVTHGDRLIFGFGQNHYLDLVFRLAAARIGAVPVTINWEADTSAQILYKIELVGAKLLLHDELFEADHLPAVLAKHPQLSCLDLAHWSLAPDPASQESVPDLNETDEKLIIFTSGTTGQPKGVAHDFVSYRCNAATFADFFQVGPQAFSAVVTSALHHANASAITDWCLRHPGSQLHLLSRYSHAYWEILETLVQTHPGLLIAPVVSRHFDFLATLVAENALSMGLDALKQALAQVTFLIGSAPVGPTTVRRVLSLTGHPPIVRFGSSETCLQVMGIPPSLSDEARLLAFERGWSKSDRIGYYIGRAHPGFTEVKIIRSLKVEDHEGLVELGEGEPGYLITRGENLMTGYVGNPEATAQVFHGDWYLGLEDIGFYLTNAYDGGRDFYWMSRDSTLLIKGGANYAYDQINSELQEYLEKQLGLAAGQVEVAVVGLKLNSEHEDETCITLNLHDSDSAAQRQKVEALLRGELSAKTLSKGARPGRIRFGVIPRNFKGAVLTSELKKAFRPETDEVGS